MTETSNALPALSTMRLAELQKLATSMGLKGTSRMRKSELVAAIRASGSAPAAHPGSQTVLEAEPAADPASARVPARKSAASAEPAAEAAAAPDSGAEDAPRPRRRRAAAAAGAPQPETSRTPERAEASQGAAASEAPALLDLPIQVGSSQEGSGGRSRKEPAQKGRPAKGGADQAPQEGSRRSRRRAQAAAPERAQAGEDREPVEDHVDPKAALMRDLADATGTPAVEPSERKRRDHDAERTDWEDEGRSGRRRRGRKRRDRDNAGAQGADSQGAYRNNGQPREDEVLLPVAGILDVADAQHAYLRTSGYLPGPKDVYVNAQQIKDNGLRPGDALTGWVREGGETAGPGGSGRGNRRQNRANRQKFNPLVSVETVNGMDPERAKRRPEFTKLPPLYPQEQLRLETTPKALTPRIIDLVAPIGKGQRGLIVSPPKAGKTIVLQQIANAISVNNPEAHLMVVLVDERPEEVTDMQRTVKGEVIASTFDRPASDHTTVAELAIERAKRLVELGQDVVVLLDSITRLGRAYNLAAPASGRILSGGVDASALYPPKRFFGAARNIENGGSLTILATALVETGSKMDEVIFEEFKGTGNMELRLSRQLAEKRIFPAVDVAASSTRREELLIDPAQLKIMWRLRRLFTGLEQQQAIELVLGKLKETSSNAEFLMVLSKTTPAGTSLADAGDD
ncbi:MAG: transcription termination factor Rho [Actinomyces sp.]|uniref:transcription termination factor Rho n=1 Tax=Actinomyces sp. TaxID=29317 RepID=UPI0026DB39B5|nr:transcription termination factor Rho [Actinomyces sp.]MDO4242335.1 transcription termination factor Rho [Actinomyces sp.]